MAALPGDRHCLNSDTAMDKLSQPTSDFDAEDFLCNLTHKPGVYRMLDNKGDLLYVGKATDLKKRVMTYFRKQNSGTKLQLMMNQMHCVEITVTATEVEALLLENNLIKEYHPRYNVLLRDDKSYPYIRVTAADFPQITFYRGSRKRPGRYFGPYPSVGSVREALKLMFKLFRLRQCDDAFFKNRARPCLQYQIKRCSAPCVGLIDKDAYREDLALATEVLSGNAQKVVGVLVERMDEASRQEDYENAARCRDQIQTLRRMFEQQRVSGGQGDADIIAACTKGGSACVQVFSVRGGLNIGNRAYYPVLPYAGISEGELLTTFIGQYYLSRQVPMELILSHAPDDAQTLQEMLKHKAGHKVTLTASTRGTRRKWLDFACDNAVAALDARLLSKFSMQKRLAALQEMLGLEEAPTRMECFDISHMQGEATVASCVVFDGDGPLKSEYRRFNIKGVTEGDDYAAMRQATERRYRRLVASEGKLPDVLFIDGGKGQVSQAREVLQELGVVGVALVGVAKGPQRKPGMETLLLADGEQFITLDTDSVGLHLIQQIRDEAHRFAITGHRLQRAGRRKRSQLEEITGLGPKRRQQLLKHFGGLRGINRASVEELSKVAGISVRLAASIYETLHVEAR